MQGTVRIFDVDDNWHPLPISNLPKQFQDEILVYYYVGEIAVLYLLIFPFLSMFIDR